MNHSKKPMMIGVLLSVALALSACATLPPPQEELDAAKLSISNAEGADAAQLSPNELSNAKNYLEQARAALTKGDETSARPLLLRASAAGDLATARARAMVRANDAEARQKQLQELRAKLDATTNAVKTP